MQPKVIVRTEQSLAFEGLGVRGAALEALLRETAAERHTARAMYARWAAEEYYLAQSSPALTRDDVDDQTLALAAGAILWADVIGVGGRDGVAGSSTRRHPAFAGCGKGRKHATDGAAWSAAIAEAAANIGGYFMVAQNYHIGFSHSYGGILVDENLVPHEWLVSICREGLRRAAGLGAWHEGIYFKTPPESLPHWAGAYNMLTEDTGG